MSKKVQHIRKSQFVLTYGPGSIIETIKGPRIIPSFNRGLKKYFDPDTLKKFEINDTRMSKLLKEISGQDSRVFELPSNSALKLKEDRYIYSTEEFPLWKICYGGSEKHETPVLFNSENRKCPQCGGHGTAVRFVAACSNGHLDDVNWQYAVHGKPGCNPAYYEWITDGSSLTGIKVKCPDCGASNTMRDIYRMYIHCSGRIPEKDKKDTCNEKMRIIQRQSSSLRIPETVTVLKVPRMSEEDIFRILDITSIRQRIEGLRDAGVDSEERFLAGMKNALNQDKYSILRDYIQEYGLKSFYDILKEAILLDDILHDEFRTLESDKPVDTPQFSKSAEQQFENRRICFRVSSIEKIHIVTAQTGYRRFPYIRKDSTSTMENAEDNRRIPSFSKTYDGSAWFCGYESVSEGLFITSDNVRINESSEAYGMWKDNRPTFRDPWNRKYVSSPIFVWWHTLSHALIRAISLQAGYPNASIRERLYFDTSTGKGGFLLYTTSTGSSCSMGGLSGCSENFDEILEMAFESIEVCSNDPLCYERKVQNGSFNGAACHNCLMLSETSCEHSNRWLDRHIILNE